MNEFFQASVRHRLVLGLSVVATFTIAATVIAAWTFMSHRENLGRIVNAEVPTLLIAADMARVGEEIASSVGPLVQAKSQSEATGITEQVLDKFTLMDDLIADLRHRDTDNETINLLQKERARITENFLALQSVIGTTWHIKKTNAAQRQKVFDMLGKKATGLPNELVEENHSHDHRPDIVEHAAALHLSQALTAPSQAGIDTATQAITALRQQVYQNPGESSARQLIDLNSNIEQLSDAAQTFLSGRSEEAHFSGTANDLVNFHRHLSDRMTIGLSELLRSRRETIAATARDADNALALSGVALLILALMSVVMVAAVALLLDRNISGRLKRLQVAMHAVASGERKTKIPLEGSDEIGEMAKSLSVFVDTLKRQEVALHTARNEAVAANRAKTQFLANMSHELRTPLNAILGFSEIIRSGAMGPSQPTRYGDYANDIHESGQYLLDLINDILDLAKIEEGKTEIKDGPVSISGCVKDALRLISHEARDAHITITTEIPASVPPIRADSRMLVQMCTNLLSNAVHFTPPGGKVKVAAYVDEFGHFVLSIEDNGMGMSPSDVDKALSAFESFEPDVRRSDAGAGLGLPLTLQLVKLHDGMLDIESAPGKGTTVYITLPAERVRSKQGPSLTIVDNSA